VPIYNFVCEDCGPFEQRRPATESGTPAACPLCRGEARRVYSMPNTRRMPTAISGAINHAEKSAHEPKVIQRSLGSASSGKKHQHGHGRPWALGH
jgi:putative FmdB family regulatory protein